MADFKKTLRTHSIAFTGAGFAFASLSIVAEVQVASFLPGNTGWIAVLSACVVCLLASTCFAELSAMFPTSAGVRVYFQKAFGEKLAIILSGTYIFIIIIASGAEAYVFGSVFQALMPAGPPVWFWMVSAFALVGYLNYRGIEISSGTQDFLGAVMFLLLITLSITAISKFGMRFENWYNPFAGANATENFIAAIGVAIFLFAGFEWVTALSEETRKPEVIPRGMVGSLLILGSVYALLNIALVSTVPLDVLSGKIPWHDGVNYGARPHVVFIKVIFGSYETAALFVVGALSFLASMTSFNAGIMTTSRFLYAMSRDKTMPKVISKIHMEYFTPYVSVIILVVIAITSSLVLSVTGGFDAFTYAVAGSEALVYVVAALSIMRLRKIAPEIERSFKVAFHPFSTIFIAVAFCLLLLMVFVSTEFAAKLGLAILVTLFVLMAVHTYVVIPRLRAKKTN
ncbi:MAG: hypothetical protein LDLANPLL_02690 [Turneriella sp.]|nr:hypothetical protein [Turneriella sp.]